MARSREAEPGSPGKSPSRHQAASASPACSRAVATGRRSEHQAQPTSMADGVWLGRKEHPGARARGRPV
eukprot:7581225-Alexandrium_andersonii.AAC.1